MRVPARRALRVVRLLSVLLLLASLLPVGTPSLIVQAASVATPLPTQTEPAPETRTVPPPTPDTTPSLRLSVTPLPKLVMPGDTLPIEISVSNVGSIPATHPVLTLPVPAGTTVAPGALVRWSQAELAAGQTMTGTTTLVITQNFTGQALQLAPQLTASNLPDARTTRAGTLVRTGTRTPQGQGTFTPGRAAAVTSPDGRQRVTLPPQAANRPLHIKVRPIRIHGRQQQPATAGLAITEPLTTAITPPETAGFFRGFETFYLEAEDTQGQPVHQFATPITITVQYTPEELAALQITEDNLVLFWFNEGTGVWEPQHTTVDRVNRTASIVVNHFSAYQLSDGSSPSAAFLPSLQAWQVSLFTGSATTSYPIEVPAGPAGIKPPLDLSYSSSATDGSLRPKDQASWVGKGWSLDTPSIARNKLAGNDNNYFSLVLNGQSLDLVRAEALQANPSATKLSHWAWRPTDETFIKARAVEVNSLAGRGGTKNAVAYQRYKWQVWTKDGTLYEFGEDLWWGFESCPEPTMINPNPTRTAYLENSKWQLSTITDVHSNTITYNYGRETKAATSSCDNVVATIDRGIWPTAITWGKNTAVPGTIDRYRVSFDVITRTNDLDSEAATNHIGGVNGAPRETKQLTTIRVESKQATTWELMRRYDFTYDYSLYSDNSLNSGGVYSANTAYPKLTLKSIQRVGKDGTTALPPMTFTYGTTRGTGLYPNGNWNRLVTVDNGQGGTSTYTYATIGNSITPNDGKFVNYRRVTQKTQTDGEDNSYTWSYAYTSPALNSLGTRYDSQSTQAEPNSAALYYNEYVNVLVDQSAYLAHRPFKEFRGHASVTETNPSGHITEHYFYQGDLPTTTCTLTATGVNLASNSCFALFRSREFLKGREYRTVQRGGSGSAALKDVTHSFRSVHPSTQTIDDADMGYLPVSGLWRAFNYERETIETFWEGGTTPATKRTVYSYDPTYQTGSVLYGNLSQTQEYMTPHGQAETLVRTTANFYNTLATNTRYIVDRVRATNVYSGSSHFLAQTAYLYDGLTTQYGLVDKGNLTLTRIYYDVPYETDLTNDTLHSQDVSQGYDAYGNVISTTTYASAGTKVFNGSTTSFSSPGNGSAARTTTTTYDSVFHAFSISTTPPYVNTSLTESADYDYRMGTMISTTDPNGIVTRAYYDVFGRMTKLVENADDPYEGDSEAIPTLQMFYADWEQPYRFVVYMREQRGISSAYRGVRHFYDGMGREIQTKHESVNDAQNIVVDMRYNGLGQTTWASQARYVNETPSTTFWTYTPLPSTGIVSSTTTYDPLGRPLDVTGPDGTVTSTRYWPSTDGNAATVTDAKAHKTRRESNVFGQLVRVIEYSGNGGSEGSYAVYGTTHYTYDPLGRQRVSIDAVGNRTTMTYDSGGRKTGMVDPDMGSWSYTYDVAGNQLTQTDAKNQTITWTYDALGRELTKTYPSSGGTIYTYYDQTTTPGVIRHGKGRRTSMTDLTGGKSWYYDARGNMTGEHQTLTISGQSTLYSTYWTYNANKSLNTLTYPTGETLTYSYNNAWQQVGVATSLGGSYLTAATYNALGQGLTQTYGNGVVATNTYEAKTSRLSTLNVQGSSGTPYQRTYGYDLAGNVQTIASASETLHYTYDHRDRLSSACTWVSGSCTSGGSNLNESYSYDVIGNLTIKAGTSYTYSSSRPHAVSSVGGNTYSYDNNGNLQSGGGRTYTWTSDNVPSQIVNGSTTETYTYDGEGTRVVKTGVTGSVTTRTVYVGAGLVEYTGTTVTTNYGIAFRTKVGNNPSTLTYRHSDHLGSTSATSTPSGNLSAAQEFTPWGGVRSGSITGTELNFTGQRRDSGTGLLYYNARYYDANLGRFLSADTIAPDPANPQSRNRYTYVLNNPLGYTDPSGHCAETDTGDCVSQLEENYGVIIDDPSAWTSRQLWLIWQALEDWRLYTIKIGAEWTYDDFKNKVFEGTVTIYRDTVADVDGYTDEQNKRVYGQYNNGGQGDITFFDLMNSYDGEQFKGNVIHEFAHRWDDKSAFLERNELSSQMDNLLGSTYWMGARIPGEAHRAPTAYSLTNRKEDFAESVASSVYTSRATNQAFFGSNRHKFIINTIYAISSAPNKPQPRPYK